MRMTLPFSPGKGLTKILTALALLCSFALHATTYTVTNTNNSGSGSFRQAILDANSNAGADIINFNIALSGVQTISLTASMDSITGPVTIDGTTEGGYAGTPLIVIDGTSAGSSAIAIPLNATATGSVVKGLCIQNFQEFGMYIEASGCSVTACYIGTDATGASSKPNGVALYITNANCTIGGTSASARNVLSGNSFYGIELIASASGATIQGNYIGVDAAGTTALANGGDGIFSSCANTTIGGTAAGAGNVISGATGGEGINFSLGADNSTVQGNLIGTDKNGTTAIGNNNTGVYIHGAKNCLVGGTTAAARNIISGNKNFGGMEMASGTGNTVEGNYIGTDITGTSALGNNVPGITLDGASTSNILNNVISGNTGSNGYGITITAGSGNIIQGNYIGLNAAGTAAIANAQSGIRIATTSANTIGGTSASQRNIISGNTKAGITQSAGSSHTIENNYIGLNATGTASIPNGTDGVDITGSNCTFGNAVSGTSNIISGNTTHGINITGSGAKVYNCYIGLNPAGTSAIANGSNGIQISGSTATIGGTSSNQPNIISGNTNNGISITAGTGTSVQGNIIGLDPTGASAIANGTNGVSISGGSGATIGGGASTATRNFISGNTGSGVSISGTATGAKIQNNYIGTNLAGTSAIANSVGVTLAGSSSTVGSDLDGSNDAAEGNIISGNTTHGILISGSSNNVRTNVIGLNASGSALANGSEGVMITGTNNTVGGSTATTATANVISGNTDRGVYIQNSTATGNTVLGNYIGTDATGTTAKPNGQDGLILDGAKNNTIGGNAATSRNIISGNTTSGILITNSATGNTIDGNYIGTNAAGSTALANSSVGIYISSGANANTIGGFGNLISGNNNVGVYVNGTSSVTGNVIKGNYIGVNAAGTAALTNNNFADISFLGGATGNTVGGPNASDRNIISGAGTSAGILISSGSQTIENNYIGTDATGSSAIHNSVGISVNSTGNTIGVATLGNVISGNTGSGIILNAGSNNIYGNYIGLNAAGTSALANGAIGISFNSSSNNNIGSSATGGGNVIAGNTVASADVEVGSGSDNNIFTGNYIHINAAGTAAISSGSHPAVLLDGATGTVLTGNVISGASGDGIRITANGATIKGNYIGVNAAGTSALANTSDGINITNTASGSTIGGTTAGDGNVVSGNSLVGILLNSTGNTVQGNIIGLNASGAAAIANHSYGLEDSKGGNTIGGNTSGARNIISGNTSHGIEITSSASTADQIQGNYIGTDITGSTAIGNGGQGIDVNSGSHTISGNVVSANSFNGIVLQSGTSSVTIKGNYVGTNAAGTAALANTDYGIVLGTFTNSNIVGGTSPGEGNLASGNTLGGIFATGASGGTIIGNLVGTDINGTSAIPNGVGIKINSSSNIVIGGSSSGDANIISGNTGDGINSSSAITVKGNLIGTDISGSTALANGNNGILCSAASNVIGGTTTNERNIISGNTVNGIQLSGSSNTIRGNYIGTNAAGTAALANGSNGISITAGGSNTIGGTTAGAGNTISGNTLNGINLQAGSNSVFGNNIGTNAAGTSALANGSAGVNISSGTFNFIGGGAIGGNIISGNTGSGVTDQSGNNSIKGNYIGVNSSSTAIANGGDGLTLSGTGTDAIGSNTIASNAGNGIKITAGNSNTISLNTIQNNTGEGVVLTSTAGTGNMISQNVIGSNSFGIDLNNDGVTTNDALDADIGPNNLQNYPVITSVSHSGGNTTIQGTLSSLASTTYNIEFFANNGVIDPTGYGQGKIYIGNTSATTNGLGTATFSATFGGTYTSVTATATDVSSNTSEFSLSTKPVAAVLLGLASISNGTLTPAFSDSTAVGNSISHTFVMMNNGTEDLTVNSITLPTGFTSSTTFPLSAIPAGSTASFNVTFSPSSAGTYSGNVVLSTSDPSNATYTFPVKGWSGCWNRQYVANSGDDNNTGSSSNIPKKTVQAAVNNICDGGTIYLNPGDNFAESVDSKGKNIFFAFTTTSSAATTISSFNVNGGGTTITLDAPLTITGTLTFTNGILKTTTANPLILDGNSASFSGGSTSSYIDGPAEFNIYGTTIQTRTIPIGKGGYYRPISLKVDVSAGGGLINTFRAEMFNTDPHTLGLTIPSGTNLAYERYFQVDRITSSGTVNSAQITLPFENDGLSDSINDLNNVKIIKGNGSGAWVSLGGSATGSLSGSYYNGSVTSNSFTSFSPFALATGCGSNPQPTVSYAFTNPSCVNSPVSFTNNTTISSGSINSYIWDFGDGSSQLVQNAGGYPPNPTTTHTYTTPGTYTVSLQATTNLSCQVVLTKYITIGDLPTAVFASSSASICSGSTTTISVSISNVPSTQTWQLKYTDGTTIYTQTGTGSGTFNYTSPVLSANTTFTFVSLTNTTTTCASTPTGSFVVSVSPTTVGGSISGAATVCAGSNSGTLSLSGNTGSVVRWEYSTDGGTTYTNITNTGSSQSYSNLSTTTIYRALIQSGVCASAYSSTATITVNSLPNATISGSSTICAGSTANLTVTVSNVGAGQSWSVSYMEGSTSKTLTGTGSGTATITTAALTATTTYELLSISETSGAVQCSNSSLSGTTIATVTVNPMPTATIGAGSTICSGNAATISVTISNVLTTDNWKLNYNEGATAKNITGTGPGSFTITTASLASNTTVTLTSIQNTTTTCTQTISGQSATITVNPTTVGGSISGAATVCAGTNSGTLTLSGNTGSVLRWEYSTDGGTTFNNITNTSSSQSYSNLSTTTIYRALVQSGVCASAYSSTVTITVNPLPNATISGSSTICAGSTANLTVTVSNVGAGQSWSVSYMEGSTSKTLTGTGSGTATITTSALTATTTYELLSISETSGAVQCSNSSLSGTTTATVNVNPMPTATIGSGSTICSGSAASISVTISNVLTTDNWKLNYNEGVTAKNITGTGAGSFTITTAALASNTTVTLTSIQNTTTTCTQTISGQSATITVNPTTVGGSISGAATVCAGTNSGTLTLSGNTGSVVRWEYSTDGGTTYSNITNTTSSQSYSNLNTTTIYRALVQSGVCASAYSSTVTITVNPLPNATINGSSTICAGSTANLTVTVSNVGAGQSWSVSYQEGSSSKTLTGTGSGSFTLTTSALSTTTTYTLKSISETSGSPQCSNSSLSGTTVATVTVNPMPTATIGSGSTICSGSAATISVTISNVLTTDTWKLNYNEGATAKNITGTGSGSFTITTASLSSNTTVALTSIQNTTTTCTQTISGQSATITVNPTTVGGTISGTATVCGTTNSGTLTLSGNTGSVLRWEYSTDGGTTWNNVVNTTSSQSYTNLSTTTTYRALVQSGVCASAYSSSATITVNPQPSASMSGSQTICSGSTPSIPVTISNVPSGNSWSLSYNEGATSKTLTGTGSGTFTLNASSLSNPPSSVTYTLNSITNTSVSPSCANTSFSSSSYTVSISPTTVGGTISGAATVCSGTNSGSLTLSGNTGSILRWEYSNDAGSTWNNITNTTTSQSYSNLTASTIYRALIQSGVCASAYSSTATITVNPLPTASISGSTTICAGSTANLTVTVSNAGAGQGWSISYQEGSSSKTLTGTGSGNFTLTTAALSTTTTYTLKSISETSGSPQCSNSSLSGTTVATVTVNPMPTATIGGSQTICSGSTPSIIVAVSNVPSGNNWSLSYSEGATSKTLTGTGSGNFTLNASTLSYPPSSVTYTLNSITNTTSSPSCTNNSLGSTYTVTINPTTVGGSISGTATVCGTVNSGTLTLSGNTGNVVRWEYSIDGGTTWNNISNTTTSQNYNNLPVTTTYRVLVQSGVCASAYSSTATITVNPQPSATMSGSQTICSGSVPSIPVTISNVPSGNNWSLSYTEGGTAKTLTGTGSGTFTLNASTLNAPPTTVNYSLVSITNTSVTPSCANNSISGSYSVSVSPTTAGGTISPASPSVCYGTNSGKLTLAGRVGKVMRWEYTTDNGNNWVNITNTDTTENFNNLTTTTKYRALVQSGVCASAYSSTATITVNPLPVATISGAPAICTGNSTSLTVTVSNVAAGDNWTVSYTEASTAKTLSGTGPGKFALNTSVLTYPPSEVDYTLVSIVNNTTTCSNTASGMATVTVNPKPVVAFRTANVCNGMTAGFVNQSSIPYGNIQGFLWKFGDKSTSSDVDPTHMYTAPGTYNVTLIAVSQAGCIDSVTKTITIYPTPVASFSAASVCGYDSMSFVNKSTISSGTMSYHWDFGDTTTSNSANPKHKYNGTGTYKVTLIVTSNNGCTSTYSTDVTVYPKPTASFYAQNVCENDTVTFYNNSSIAYGNMTYLWDFGGSTSNLETPKFRFVGSGKFKVMLVAISNFGCRDTSYQTIIVYPHPTANFSTTPVCIGKESIFKSLSTVGSGSVTDYLWNFGDSTYSSGPIVKHTYSKPGTYNVWLIVKTDKGCTDTLENPMIVYPLPTAKITPSSSTSFCIGGSVVLSAPPGMNTYDWSTGETTQTITVTKQGMYHVKVTNNGGCGSEDSIKVTVYPLPVINAGRDTTISKGYSAQLHATGAKTYSWSPSVGLDNDHTGNPVATPLTNTTYIVTGYDSFGCSNTDTITITVVDDHRFHVFNIVTPNGDGQNDTWYIGNIETYQDCEVTIYNRYGQVLYQTTNYKNDWNGTYHGEQLPEGAYFYTIKCPGDDNVYKGSISILRNK